MIVDFNAPIIVKQLCTTLGHIGYYCRFMHGYAQITVHLEKLLKKDAKFVWIEECQKVFDALKEKLVTTPILVYPY